MIATTERDPLPAETTIGRLLQARASDMPDAVFAIFPDREMRFGEIEQKARAVAKGLIALGVQPGMHVATLMPNCPDWLPAYFGILYAGAALVALNARYKRHELAYAIEHSDARVLITTDAVKAHVDFAELLADSLGGIAIDADETRLTLKTAPKLSAIVLMGAARSPGFLSLERLVALGAAIPDAAVDAALDAVKPGDVAALIYTSGTTSNPKGCALTHLGLQRSWRTFAEVVSLKAGEIVWMPMPFFHTGGIGPMTAMLARGAAFMTQAYFDPEQAVALIEKHRIAHLYSGFPQYSLAVLDHPTYSIDRFDFIRSMLNVGPPAMQRRIQALLPEGAKLLNLFGMTEGAGIVTFTPWNASLEVRASTSGEPPAHTQIRIVAPETARVCEPDEPGEIQFRGGGAFSHYHRDSGATRETILDGGWVRTGDRGRIDVDGWLHYLGRLKDMLKVGGENVAAAEIESFLAQHPGVGVVQVIGAPDARLNEVPVAFVERAQGESVSERDLLAMCDGQLAKWKIPRAIVFVTEWPMSSTKVQKFRLRDLLPERYRPTAA